MKKVDFKMDFIAGEKVKDSTEQFTETFKDDVTMREIHEYAQGLVDDANSAYKNFDLRLMKIIINKKYTLDLVEFQMCTMFNNNGYVEVDHYIEENAIVG